MNQFSSKFKQFLEDVSKTSFETNTTATGAVTIQQSARNTLRKQGLEALKADLEALYGENFDILETKEGLVIAVENEPTNFTFSWELKSTIKSIDYDPFIEASNWDDEVAQKASKREAKEREREARLATIAEKREAKLAELAARKAKRDSQAH